MPSDSKISYFIVQLTRATVEGNIKWKFADAPTSINVGTGDVIATYLEAEHRLQRVALYERRYLGYNSEIDSAQWESNIVLAFLDKEDRVIWDYHESPLSVCNLFKVARESAAGIDRILDNFLG
jgi:hypothetical protein